MEADSGGKPIHVAWMEMETRLLGEERKMHSARSLTYAAVRSTSLVEHLARGSWGRLHFHNSIKDGFRCLPLSLFLGDTCVGEAIKKSPLRKAELHLPSHFEEDAACSAAVETVQDVQEREAKTGGKNCRYDAQTSAERDEGDADMSGL